MNQFTGKSSKQTQVKIRLNELAIARTVKVEVRQLNYYASCLAEFSFEAIDEAIRNFEAEIPREFKPRWPDIQALMAECRRIQQGNGRPKFYCSDCDSEDGFLWFDTRTGKRLRGAALVLAAGHRRFERCPCGGTERDWLALELDHRTHPENYYTLNDVVDDVIRRRPDLKDKLRGYSVG